MVVVVSDITPMRQIYQLFQFGHHLHILELELSVTATSSSHWSETDSGIVVHELYTYRGDVVSHGILCQPSKR